MIRGEPQPKPNGLFMVRIRATMPAADMNAPSQSYRWRPPIANEPILWSSRMYRPHRNATEAGIAMKRNSPCQPHAWINRPPITGPEAAPMATEVV